MTMIRSKDLICWRNIILLISSYYFYAFLKWEYIFLLFGVTFVNYISSLLIDKERNRGNLKRSRYWMLFSVVLSISILGYFKYTNFFIDSVYQSLSLLGIKPASNLLKIALPVGISFFTFQALTYTIDVYKNKLPVRSNFIDVALFISFFPTILSGPIEKARNLLPQIEQKNKISLSEVFEGGKRFVWGLFKKLVIADRLAVYVNNIYGSIEDQSSLTLLVAALFYSFQIYADFSGYSDMAIGIARALGFKLMENFNYPYFSNSIKEFWKRWHISLTSWFTEYVYIPLGGNRVSTSRWIFNISSVFLLSGLWHGANWSFIFWGTLHAIFYIIEFYYKKTKIYFYLRASKIIQYISPVFSFILVTFAWIFFRIEAITLAWNGIFRIISYNEGFYWGISAFSTALSMFLLLFFIGLDWIKYKRKKKWNPYLVMIGYACLLCLIILFGEGSGGFVYFQF